MSRGLFVWLLIGLSLPVQASEEVEPWRFALLPIVNYSTDRGFGYGAYGQTFYLGDDGAGDEPYLASFGGQFYQTTGAYQDHRAFLDLRDLVGTGLRVDFFAGYEAWAETPYYGNGNNLPRGRSSSLDDSQYAFGEKSFRSATTVYVPVVGDWFVLSGLDLRHSILDVVPGSVLSKEGPRGADGGTWVSPMFGMMLDTRDREPSTRRGFATEWTFRGGHPWVGSDWSSFGGNLTHRHFIECVGQGRLVLALLGMADFQWGEPFFQEHRLGGTLRQVLGGNGLLRGYPVGRIRGNVTGLGVAELRWRYTNFEAWDQDIELSLVPFVDGGRVWEAGEAYLTSRFWVSGGVSPRMEVNELFVLRLDLVASLEHYRETKGHGAGLGPAYSVYLVVNQPF